MKKIIRASTIPLSLNIFCRGTFREMSKNYDVVALSSFEELLDEVEKREGVRAIRIEMERRISTIKDFVRQCLFDFYNKIIKESVNKQKQQ